MLQWVPNTFYFLREQAVKNFFNKTSSEAFGILVSTTHDIAWNLGPFGENFGSMQYAFMGSSVPLESGPPLEDDSTPTPLPHEPSISIDWSLPMTESAQVMLFQRIVTHWERMTSSFPVAMKKKYRMGGEEVLKTRNMLVLANQLMPHLRSRMSPESFEEFRKDVVSNSKRDGDLHSLLMSRPSRFSMSMLVSEQENAKRDQLDAENKKIEETLAQKADVDAAQWSYFCGALKRDHSKMETVQSAPRLVRQRLHAKQVAHRTRLAAEGEAACRGYQDRCQSVEPTSFTYVG